MNDTLALPRIIAQLAELAQTDEATASAFISEFVTLIENALAQGEKVSIKQIGTFSPGDPVNFTPAHELADAINAPFAIFEAVELPDDYSENDEPYATPDESKEKEYEKELTGTPDNNTETETNPGIVESEQQPVCAGKSSCVEPNEQTTPDNTETDSAVPSATYVETQKRTRRTHLKIAAALLAGFSIGIATGFHFGQNHGTKGLDNGQTITGIATSDTNHIPANDPPSIIEPEIIEPVYASEPEIYDTISKTRFLTTMARKYYGKMDYWVYIYEENSDFLSNPNRISPGTRVKIPPFNKYATSPDDSVNLTDARARAVRIYSKYR